MAPRLSSLCRFWPQLDRAAHGVTLGVRGLVFDHAGQVLLVEHTYLRGWYLPGGGVERGETASQALEREMVEEAGVQILGAPRLASVHDNGRQFSGDFVLFYQVEQWAPIPPTSYGEIARIGFFSIDDLPAGVTPATRRRLGEVQSGTPPDLTW